MRNDIIVLFTTLVMLLIQISVIPASFMKGWGLILPLIYLVALTANFPMRTIFVNAFIIGVVQDNFSGGLYGFHTIALIVLSYFTVRARESMHSEDAYIPALFTGAFLAVYEIAFLVWCTALKYSVGNWSSFLLSAVGSIAVSVIFAYPINELCDRLYKSLTTE